MLRRRLSPVPAAARFHFRQIEPAEQHRQFLRPHSYAGLLRRSRPAEPALLQTLGAHPKPAPIPEQGFDPTEESCDIMHLVFRSQAV